MRTDPFENSEGNSEGIYRTDICRKLLKIILMVYLLLGIGRENDRYLQISLNFPEGVILHFMLCWKDRNNLENDLENNIDRQVSCSWAG